MPEPWPFLRATAVAAAVGFILVAVASRFRRAANESLLSLFAMAAGFAAGCYAFPIELKWPPLGGLDRFLLVVLPAAFLVELAAGVPRVPAWCAWMLRATVAAAGGIVLLYNSVYLAANGPWPFWDLATLLAISPLVLVAEWLLLLRLDARSPGVATPWSMALAIAAAGMMVMLGGYIKGGAVAFPLAAAVAGVSVWPKRGSSSAFQNGLGFALAGLFGILFVGHFFGRISFWGAVTVLVAPLLGWGSEFIPKRHQKRWLVATVRIAAVAIPLTIVLAIAKRDFDRKAGPLSAVHTRVPFTSYEVVSCLLSRGLPAR